MATCNRCGGEIEFRRVDGAAKPFEPDTGERHRCGQDVYDQPESKRLRIFNPKDNEYRRDRVVMPTTSVRT